MKPRTGYLSFVLHAHQPYVLHHGTWPHGLEWLLEAAAETYLPLLGMVKRLQADSVPFTANVSLSPILLEQLGHPDFQAELPQYLQRKVAAAREDAAFFDQAGEQHLLYLARHWEQIFQGALDILNSLGDDLIAGFREAEASGALHLLTSAATHGYAPLLGTDESLRAQFATAVRAHKLHLGQQPRGVWLPECGYRPAGPWKFPVQPDGGTQADPVDRIGVEDALAEAGLLFTFVDSHLVADGQPVDAPSGMAQPNAARGAHPSLYYPHRIGRSSVTAFARDPRSAFQVWSAQFGYPGDFAYLDFHKKRWPGGHRYWRVTGEALGMDQKQAYDPASARERSLIHAAHFVALVEDTLQTNMGDGDVLPILCAPFDLELFGHWWHEGLHFLENVARALASGNHPVAMIGCLDYLEAHGPLTAIDMQEGSWGTGGDSSVWLNAETGALVSRVYAAELAVQEASQHPQWGDGTTGERIARQMCRELLLMEASDWPTLITTGAARDYAERRFDGHAHVFADLLDLWQQFLRGEVDAASADGILAPLETRDGIFPDLDPADWCASGSKAG
ncbi:MAG: 1,4-alpha-glucan branching protein domain-containing protein [Janthinobacterium lividum]